MKKLLILFLLPFLVSAQTEKYALSKEPIVVGEARNTNGIVATMNKIVGNPDYYIMSFKNIKNTSNSDFITFGFCTKKIHLNYLNGQIPPLKSRSKTSVAIF